MFGRDAGHYRLPETGNSCRSRHRNRRRMPAGSHLRSGYCGQPCPFCHAGSAYRFVLLDADGRAIAQYILQKAMQMLLTGEMVSAEQAAEWGLINQAVPVEELQEAAALRPNHCQQTGLNREDRQGGLL